MTKPMGMESFSFAAGMQDADGSAKAIASQTFGSLTRWSADGDVEYMGRDGEWTPSVHKAYLVPERHIKDIGFYAAIDPIDGGSHSAITMALYPEDKKRPFRSSVLRSASHAPVRREWDDCVAIARPIGDDQSVIRGAEMLFLSHHGVEESVTTLTGSLSRAVVCELGQIDEEAKARLNEFSAAKAPGWHGYLDIAYEPVRRVITIAPIAAGPK